MLLPRLSPFVPPLLYWSKVAQAAGLEGTSIKRATTGPLGWILLLRLRPPATASLVAERAELIATAVGAARVRVTPDPYKAHEVIINIDYLVSLVTNGAKTKRFPAATWPAVILPATGQRCSRLVCFGCPGR